MVCKAPITEVVHGDRSGDTRGRSGTTMIVGFACRQVAMRRFWRRSRAMQLLWRCVIGRVQYPKMQGADDACAVTKLQAF